MPSLTFAAAPPCKDTSRRSEGLTFDIPQITPVAALQVADKGGEAKDKPGDGSAGGVRIPDEPRDLPLLPGENRKVNARLRGRIEADAAYAVQSARNLEIWDDIQNSVGFRRARLGAEGTVGDQVFWVSEIDFAGGNVLFRDVFVGLDKLPYLRRIRVGHFREPYGLEGTPSSNDMTFMERSPMDTFNPARNWGVGFASYTDEQRATFQGGVFRLGTTNSGEAIGDANDLSWIFRLTGLPWYDEASKGRQLMHLGGTFAYNRPPNNEITFSQDPLSGLVQVLDDPLTPFLNEFSIPASTQQLYNLQWAVVLGSVSFQAEWTLAHVKQPGAIPPVNFHGSYVQGSWFLTGENRNYMKMDGRFTTIHVNRPFFLLKEEDGCVCGPGAWELVARFAYLDLDDDNIAPDKKLGYQRGGKLATFTTGFNWYLNDNCRIMFNYIHAVPVSRVYGPSYVDSFFIRTAVFW
ncbi:MAG: OprO/OprP family phosphate-selective porin [Gemmataceae bacterium]